MGIRDLFGSNGLDATLRKAQRRLAAGDFDEAHRLVSKGLERFPDSDLLHDLDLTVRRAQARTGMRSLKERITETDEPRAYDQLITLYLELGLDAEARQEAGAYANAHPDKEGAHLILGEMALQAFFEGLQARDAHDASTHLRRAAQVNADGIKSRLLLAELYFCVGADHALTEVLRSLETIAPNDPLLDPLLDRIADLEGKDAGVEILDGIFERIEVEGALVREPTAFPIRQRKRRTGVDKERAQRAVESLIKKDAAAEVVVVQRSGAVLAHAIAEASASDENQGEEGLVDVTRVVARTVSQYARELDLGRFKRCSIEGPFGLVAIGDIGGAVAGARWRTHPEPQRLWDRVSLGLEGALGGGR